MALRERVAVHFRVVFEDADRLEVLPASHVCWTPDELRIRSGTRGASDDMPKAVRVYSGPATHAFSTPGRFTVPPTGAHRFDEAWDRLDAAGRREICRASGLANPERHRRPAISYILTQA